MTNLWMLDLTCCAIQIPLSRVVLFRREDVVMLGCHGFLVHIQYELVSAAHLQLRDHFRTA